MGLFKSDVAGRIAGRILQEDVDDHDDDELFAMSVRIPETLRAVIDEMASQAGVSRNTLATDLLWAGVSDVLDRLPPELAQDLRNEAGGRI